MAHLLPLRDEEEAVHLDIPRHHLACRSYQPLLSVP